MNPALKNTPRRRFMQPHVRLGALFESMLVLASADEL